MDFVYRHKGKLIIGVFGAAAIVIYKVHSDFQHLGTQIKDFHREIRDYKQKVCERDKKIEGLKKELYENKQEILSLQNKCKIFDQQKDDQQVLTRSIKVNVNIMKDHLLELKQVVEDLESHVNQLDNQNI